MADQTTRHLNLVDKIEIPLARMVARETIGEITRKEDQIIVGANRAPTRRTSKMPLAKTWAKE